MNLWLNDIKTRYRLTRDLCVCIYKPTTLELLIDTDLFGVVFCQHRKENIIHLNPKGAIRKHCCDCETDAWNWNTFFQVLTNHTQGDAFMFSSNNQYIMRQPAGEYKSKRKKKVIIRRLLSSCYSKILFYILTDFAKAGAHCGRQSLLLSEPFPSILKRWRTKIASISTKKTYQGWNAPMTSFLTTSRPVSRLKKNRRKRGNDTPAMRKTSWAARFVSKYRH